MLCERHRPLATLLAVWLIATTLGACGGGEAPATSAGPEPPETASQAAPPSTAAPEASPAGPARRQVILLLLDAARPDRFSCYGYDRETTPEMDRLAAGGAIFRHHYAQGTGTRESLPALLYSRYFSPPIFPNDPQVPYSNPQDLFRRPDGEQISFVEALEQAGFRTAAISAHLWTGRDTPFAAEFQEMYDLTAGYKNPKYPYPRASAVVFSAIDWIGRNKDHDYFLYLHLMDTHFPHYFEAEAQELFGAAAYDASNFTGAGAPTVPPEELSESDRRYIDALYDGSLRHTDTEVGRLIDYLRREGLLEQTVIAITADHGEHLLDGPGGAPRPGAGIFSHGGPWLEPVGRIPLLLHAPGKVPAGTVFEALSEGVDAAPTLLSLAGVPVPEGKAFDGIDLAAVIAGRAEPRPQALMHGALRSERYKLLLSTPDEVVLGREAPRPDRLRGRLYDLEADPLETENLFRARPEVVADLVERYRRALRAKFERAQAARGSEQPAAAFAVSVNHFETEPPLPRVEGEPFPDGWSLLPGEPHSVLIAQGTGESLTLSLRLPDGSYRLSVGMMGQAAVEVGGQRRDLSARQTMVEFGEIEVSGETFRATIHPREGRPLRIFYFGFTPPGHTASPAEIEERRRRLKALGYIQ